MTVSQALRDNSMPISRTEAAMDSRPFRAEKCTKALKQEQVDVDLVPNSVILERMIQCAQQRI
jgi:hypothetical protein